MSRFPALIALAVLSGSACTNVHPTVVERGSVHLCIDGDPTLGEGVRTWDVTGEVVSDEEAAVCNTESGRVLVLRQSDGVERTFGYAARGEGIDYTPTVLELASVGDVVSLHVRQEEGWSMDLAFTLRDGEGHLLAAGAEGYDTQLDLPELSVSAGEHVGRTVSDECGRWSGVELVVSDPAGAWGPHAVGPRELATVGLSDVGSMFRFFNPGAWGFEGEVNCTDTWGPSPWIAVETSRA